MADSTAAASSSISSEWRSISATEPNIASGLAVPLPAMSGAEPCTGSYSPGPPSPSEALGSRPIEPAIIAASSERMSPNMFSVRITSKSAGRATSCIAALSTSMCSSCTSGILAATRVDRLAPQPRGLEDVRLVDARHAACAARPERQPGDPLDLLDRVDAVSWARRRRGPVAEVDAARELAHDDQVGALDAVARAGSRRAAPRSAAPGAGSRTGRGPCAGRAGPAPAAARPGSVVSHFGPPTAPSRTASAPRQASSTSR